MKFNGFNILREGTRAAWKELIANSFRSFLSLTGITIGIICIIGATSAVESLEAEIKNSFKKLGEDVVYIQKWPWADPGEDWWKFFQRPTPTMNEYLYLKEQLTELEEVGYYVEIGSTVIKTPDVTVEDSYILGVSDNFFQIISKDFKYGRFLSPAEYSTAAPKTILGYEVALELFGDKDPLGEKVKFKGRYVEIVGVIDKEGESMINIMNFDEIAIIGLEFARNFGTFVKNPINDGTILAKAGANLSIGEMQDQITGVLRGYRRLSPRDNDSFAINRLTLLDDILSNFFGVLNLTGFVIGIFSIFVGMFSVANIMFVSVKERTSMIGIKKALGASHAFILVEFLIESIILCLVGGGIGLLFVYALVSGLSLILPFEMFLSYNKIILGVSTSMFIGVVAGVIPAIKAAFMNPVEAIRK